MNTKFLVALIIACLFVTFKCDDAETIECMADCGAVDLTTDAEFYSCISGKDLENLTDMSDFVSAYEDCEDQCATDDCKTYVSCMSECNANLLKIAFSLCAFIILFFIY